MACKHEKALDELQTRFENYLAPTWGVGINLGIDLHTWRDIIQILMYDFKEVYEKYDIRPPLESETFNE